MSTHLHFHANTDTFYQNVDMLGAGVSQGSMGLAIVQVSQTPVCIPSMLESRLIMVYLLCSLWSWGNYLCLWTMCTHLHFHALLLFSSNFSSFRVILCASCVWYLLFK
jgi:hypothetical protein